MEHYVTTIVTLLRRTWDDGKAMPLARGAIVQGWVAGSKAATRDLQRQVLQVEQRRTGDHRRAYGESVSIAAHGWGRWSISSNTVLTSPRTTGPIIPRDAGEVGDLRPELVEGMPSSVLTEFRPTLHVCPTDIMTTGGVKISCFMGFLPILSIQSL